MRVCVAGDVTVPRKEEGKKICFLICEKSKSLVSCNKKIKEKEKKRKREKG